MYKHFTLIGVLWVSVSLVACGSSQHEHDSESANGHGEHGAAAEPEKGSHGGRLLTSGDFTLELSIFETGVPPEFRVWPSSNGEPISPEKVDLNIKLTRLGGKVDDINFRAQSNFLRGDTVIYEPHSFVVGINAQYNGQTHTWEYDNFEGRTKIADDVAEAFELETDIAGPQVMEETLTVRGRIVPNVDGMREVSARFEGAIRSVKAGVGEKVGQGQTLATVESNESLQTYSIKAPISGVITERKANAGEQTGGRELFTIMNTSSVWAELALFPADQSRVKVGDPVTITPATGGQSLPGKIARIDVMAGSNQAVDAIVVLNNPPDGFRPGTFVTAQIKVAEHNAELAVKRKGLQSFRDFTVVYAKIGEQYEVRMLDLGRQDGEWAQVLGGLEPGTRYVTENSYLIKADIEKSGASHDH